MLNIPVQINGKVRDSIYLDTGADEESAKATALQSLIVKKWLEGKQIERYNLPKKFVLFIGSIEPRKNLMHTNQHHHERVMEDLKIECLNKSVKQHKWKKE